MTRLIFFLLIINLALETTAQQNVAVNSTHALPHASAQLEICSTPKGIQIPGINRMQRVDITSPATGLMTFDTDTHSSWAYNGTGWTNLTTSYNSWSLTGSSGTNPSAYYIATSDNADLRFKLNAGNTGLPGNNANIFCGLRSGNNL